MPQEFKAIITSVANRTPPVLQVFGNKPWKIEHPKSAEFSLTLTNIGECPWPPFSIVGKTVRVIVED